MNIHQYQFSKETTTTELKSMCSDVDRIIQRAVKTGSANALNALVKLPYSINGQESTERVKQIMTNVSEQSDTGAHYRWAYLDAISGPVSIDHYFSGCEVSENFLHKTDNSLAWILSRLLAPTKGQRLASKPTYTRKNIKAIQTVFQAQHGVQMPKNVLLGMITNCFPLLTERTRRTAPNRSQSDAFKLPKNPKHRQWFKTYYSEHLVKAKILRNELMAAINTVTVIELLDYEGLFTESDPKELTRGVVYAYVKHLLDIVAVSDEDMTTATAILDDFLIESDPVEEYALIDWNKASAYHIVNGFAYKSGMAGARGVIEKMISDTDPTFFNGAQRTAVLDAIGKALKAHNELSYNWNNLNVLSSN